MAGRELFVWYRVRRDRAVATRAAVVALQRSLVAAWPGLQARLLVRDENGTSTWMETYSRPSPATGAERGVDDAIEAAIAAAAGPLDDFIDGARHVEAFDAVG